MVKKVLPIFLTFMILIGIQGMTLGAATQPANAADLPDRDTVLQSIGQLEKNPFGPAADAARDIVVRYTYESSDVNVLLAPELFPWYDQSVWSKILIVSYMAGNVRSQLERHKNENDSYAGLLTMIGTYQAIQRNDPSFKIADIDKLVGLSNQKKLQQYVTDLLKTIKIDSKAK